MHFKIKRQDSPTGEPYWHEFEFKAETGMTVISALKSINCRPVNLDGVAVAPVLSESQCQKGQCGSCTMLVNGQVKLGCSTRLDELESSVRLEPLSQFSVVRDLCVDRTRLSNTNAKMFVSESFENFSPRLELLDLPRESDALSTKLFACLECGACVEACPESSPKNSYVGPLALVQAYRRQRDSQDKMLRSNRLQNLLKKGGIPDCDNAQSCIKACPVELPITDAIARLKREGLVFALKNIFE